MDLSNISTALVGRLSKGSGAIREYVGTTIDVSERKQSEDALRDAQADLARAARLATMGELTTLIAHEVSQPLMAIVTNADTCLSWLTNANPNLDGARQAAERLVRNGHRAGSIVKSIRALARKSEPEMAQFDVNDAIGEILVLLPGMSRLQLQNHLSASGSRIPIIMITAFPGDDRRALAAGAICFLCKPVIKEDLLTCIRWALDQRHSGDFR